MLHDISRSAVMFNIQQSLYIGKTVVKTRSSKRSVKIYLLISFGKRNLDRFYGIRIIFSHIKAHDSARIGFLNFLEAPHHSGSQFCHRIKISDNKIRQDSKLLSICKSRIASYKIISFIKFDINRNKTSR